MPPVSTLLPGYRIIQDSVIIPLPLLWSWLPVAAPVCGTLLAPNRLAAVWRPPPGAADAAQQAHRKYEHRYDGTANTGRW